MVQREHHGQEGRKAQWWDWLFSMVARHEADKLFTAGDRRRKLGLEVDQAWHLNGSKDFLSAIPLGP